MKFPKRRNWLLVSSCTKDSECDAKKCRYCLSTGICGTYEQDYCNTNNCGRGDGDCDSDHNSGVIINGCPSGYVCRNNTFLKYHPDLKNCLKTNGINDVEVCIDGNKRTQFIINDF